MKKLLDEMKLSSGVTLKNRVFVSPMTIQSAFYDGGVTEDMIEYYSHRSGDAGAVVVESAFVEVNGKGFPGALGIDKDDKIIGLTKLANAIKEKGSKAFIQLYHAGRMAWQHIMVGQNQLPQVLLLH